MVVQKPPGNPHRDQYELVITLIKRLLPWRQRIKDEPVPVGQEFYGDDYGG